jgi:hypothetical protein
VQAATPGLGARQHFRLMSILDDAAERKLGEDRLLFPTTLVVSSSAFPRLESLRCFRQFSRVASFRLAAFLLLQIQPIPAPTDSDEKLAHAAGVADAMLARKVSVCLIGVARAGPFDHHRTKWLGKLARPDGSINFGPDGSHGAPKTGRHGSRRGRQMLNPAYLASFRIRYWFYISSGQ